MAFFHIAFISLSFLAGANGNAFDEIRECSTDLAEICFRGFYESFERVNFDLNTTDLCSIANERINCATNVIDTDCNIQDGRDNFDNWIKGLTSVYNYLCMDSTKSLEDLFMIKNDTRCFDLINYIQCIEESVRITHIVDMLHVSLDLNECNWILTSFTTCGLKSVSQETLCNQHNIEHTLSEVLQIFLQQTRCSSVCSNSVMGRGSPKIIFILLILTKMFIKLR